MSASTVSIVVTTKNEEKNIELCLKSILNQTYKNIEIIVVDNQSSDRTKEISRKYTEKVFDKGPERSAQRNYGMIEKAMGEYVMYVDADMIFSPDLVERCVTEIEADKKNQIVALHIPEVILGSKFFSRVRRFEREFYDGTLIDAVRFIRKDALEKIGGFDENLLGPEDWDLDKRLKKEGKLIQLPRKTLERKIDFTWNQEVKDAIRSRGIRAIPNWSAIYHNESELELSTYFSKKQYYSGGLEKYARKWGSNDIDVKKQLGAFYRLFGVFVENGKFRELIAHPFLTLGMFFLRFLVGIQFLRSKVDSSIFNKWFYLLNAVFLSSLISWNFSPFFEEGKSFAAHGDAVGIVSEIYSITEDFNNKGFSVIFGDTYTTENYGLGLLSPRVITSYWKGAYAFLGQFLAPDDVYDFLALIEVVLLALSILLLFYELKINPLLALFSTYLFLSIDNIPARIYGHLNLVSPYPVFLMIWAAVRAARVLSYKRVMLFAFFSVFNFVHAEYYGYFGVFFIIPVFVGYLVCERVYPKVLTFENFIAKSLFFIFVFLTFFALNFPEMTVAKLLARGGEVTTSYAHGANEFRLYAIRRFYHLWMTSSNELHSLIGAKHVSASPLHEFSFRNGVLMPFLALVFSGILALVLFFRERSWSRVAFWRSPLFYWFLGAGIAIMFLLPFDHKFSLVPLTQKYAPMFRVSVRAGVFVTVALLVVFALSFQRVFKFLPNVYIKSIFLALLLPLLGRIPQDIGHFSWFRHFHTYDSPTISSYEVLKSRPPGKLLELPFPVPEHSFSEVNYIFFYNRIAHGKQVVNSHYHAPHNTKYAKEFNDFAYYVNDLTKKTLFELVETELRYLVIHKNKDGMRKTINLVKSSGCFSKVYEDVDRIFYEKRIEYIDREKGTIRDRYFLEPYKNRTRKDKLAVSI